MSKIFLDSAATMAGAGISQLSALCQAVGFDEAQRRAALSIFDRFAAYWGSRRLAAGPPGSCDVTDDHTPFEFSVAFDGGSSELRILFELQADQQSLAAHWQAAAALNHDLAAVFGAELARLQAVADLFAPTTAPARFAIWHAVCLMPGALPTFKVYLNPHARGASESAAVVQAALARLGFSAAFAQLPSVRSSDSYAYFSLDLCRGQQARVKLYTVHPGALSSEIEAAVAGAEGHVTDQAREFCEAMAESPGPYARKPVFTCLSFTEGNARPQVATVHFPVRAYAVHDGAVRERVLRYIHPEGVATYERAVAAVARRPLAAGVGIHSYVSLRINKRRKHLTIYLAPELFKTPNAKLPAA